MLRRPPVVLIALALAACNTQPDGAPSPAPPAPTTATAATDAAAAATQLETLFAEHFEASLELSPIRSTFLGERRYNDRLPNMLSPEYREKQRAFEQEWLDRARAIDANALTGQDRLSHDMFVREREDELAGFAFPGHLQPVNQFYNIASMFAMLGSGTNAQPFQTVQDYDNWLKRLEQFPVLMDQ